MYISNVYIYNWVCVCVVYVFYTLASLIIIPTTTHLIPFPFYLALLRLLPKSMSQMHLHSKQSSCRPIIHQITWLRKSLHLCAYHSQAPLIPLHHLHHHLLRLLYAQIGAYLKFVMIIISNVQFEIGNLSWIFWMGGIFRRIMLFWWNGMIWEIRLQSR